MRNDVRKKQKKYYSDISKGEVEMREIEFRGKNATR